MDDDPIGAVIAAADTALKEFAAAVTALRKTVREIAEFGAGLERAGAFPPPMPHGREPITITDCLDTLRAFRRWLARVQAATMMKGRDR